MRIKVYVSGPFTVGGEYGNTRNAILAADELLEAGFVPFVPHLAGIWHIAKPHTWQEWMDWDMEWLPSCNAVLRLPGESKGGDIETAKAKEMGLSVFYSTQELIDYYKNIEKGS